jgi:hypothetical protein
VEPRIPGGRDRGRAGDPGPAPGRHLPRRALLGHRVDQPGRARLVDRRLPGRPSHRRDPARGGPYRLAPPAHHLPHVAEPQSSAGPRLPRRRGSRRCLAGRHRPSLDQESLVLERLAYLSAHEVGHTLGFMHNFAGTTFGWGSVMDYLAAHVELRGGRLDLGDAYPKDVGSYDRLMVRWGYSATDDPTALDRIVREAYAAGDVYPRDSDPRWAEYDWGKDPGGLAPHHPGGAIRNPPPLRRGAALARRAGLRPAGALLARLSLPPLRNPGRAAVRGRAVPDERARGGRSGADGLGGRGEAEGSARPPDRRPRAEEPRHSRRDRGPPSLESPREPHRRGSASPPRAATPSVA